MKILAAQADRRWAEKGSFLEQPRRGVLEDVRSEVDVGDEQIGGRGEEVGEEQTENDKRKTNIEPEVKEMEDPWKQAKGGPSEEWQPQAWGGGKAAIRR